ncbi:MAG: ABC transporter ATP-binding protein/permease [Gammaproteobacteria bacterium]|nr:MAG: ABC transporter ATP-binding protein/permease [Gammaproteobacteria bacterium]
MAHFYSYTERPHGNRDDWNNLKRLTPFLWDYRGRVLMALTSLILAKLANVGVPIVLKEIVDALDQPQHLIVELPIILLLAYGILRLASSLFNELRDALFARVRYRAMRHVANRLLEHLHRLSLRFHLERKTGAITRDLERGGQSVSSILNYLTFNIIPLIVEFLLVASILFINYDWQFAIVTLVTVAIYIVFTLMVTEWRMGYRLKMNAMDSQSSMQAVDSLINYETVKYFGNEKLELKRYDETQAHWEDAAVMSQTSMSTLNFGQGAIIAIGVTLIMIFAANGVLEGKMSLGDLVLVNAFLLQLFMPLGFLGVVYRQIKYSLADMDRMLRLLEETPEIKDKAGAKDLLIRQGEVCFDNVSFSYQDDRQILFNISFTIPAGEKVAVVGASGAGKSTLSRLLFRFYEVNDGKITIDDNDIRDVTQSSLRASIGIVPQDTVLFNDSILYNLSYARPDASQAEIINAARLAHIHDFIETLPKGYETIVGERGLKLSGGEKQRVAIARAILKSPKILIFDEATSSLDSKSERGIQKALQEVAENHTTLVIAHRLSTIVDADEILVLADGKITERGRHEELLELGGLYTRMWTLQQKKSHEND